MSSRVQKGGPIFRPVAKPRGRSTTASASRQSSVVGDSWSSLAPAGASDESNSFNTPVDSPFNVMPPPSIIPIAARENSPEVNRPRAPPSFGISSAIPRVISSSSQPLKIIHHASSQNYEGKAIAPPTRNAPVLLTVGQSRSFPIHVLPPAPVQSDQTISYNLESRSENAERVLMGPPPVLFQGFGEEAGPSSALDPPVSKPSTPAQPIDSPNAENARSSSPKRKSKRKLKVGDEEPPTPGDKTKKPRKSSRSKSTSTPSETLQERDVDANGNSTDGTGDPTGRKRNRRSTSVPRKPRKPRGPSHPPLDPEADPGEDLDPTIITMADLCKDTGQGRISSKALQIQSNHAAWKASNRERRARMRTLMESKKYGRKDDAEETEAGLSKETPVEITDPDNTVEVLVSGSRAGSPTLSDEQVAEDETGQGFDYSQAMATSRFNVQVRIGPNGETIVDEESLYVDRNDENENLNYTHVEESDTTKFVNSATYGKKFKGSRWSAEETELFFDALSQFGENYELISFVLPGRDRKSCKNKFKAEDKRNPNRINHCLNNRTPYDINTLSRMTGKDFSGPTPEIHAPEVLSLSETTKQPEETAPFTNNRVRKKSSTPRAPNDGVEVLGDVSTFEKDGESDSG